MGNAATVASAGEAITQDGFRWLSAAVMANGLPILAYTSRRPYVPGGAEDEDGYLHPRVARYVSATSIAAPIVVDDPSIVGRPNGFDNESAVSIATNGSGGLIVVVFISPALHRVVVRRSSDLGATWTAVEPLSTLSGTFVDPYDIRGHFHQLYYDHQSGLFHYAYAFGNTDQLKYVTSADGANWSPVHFWGRFATSNGSGAFQSRIARFFRTQAGTWIGYGNLFNNNGAMGVIRYGNGVCDTTTCWPTQQIELWKYQGAPDTDPPSQEQQYVLHTPGAAFYLPNSSTPTRIHLLFGATGLTGFRSIPRGHLLHWWSDDDGRTWWNENGQADGTGNNTSLLGAADAETPSPEPTTGPLGDIAALWIPDLGETQVWGVEANSNNNAPGIAMSRFADGTRDQTRVQGVGGYPTTPPDFGAAYGYTFGSDPNAAMSADPVNLGTGVFTTHASDLSMPGRILSLAFGRWYNSADTTTGPLGPAWTHSYNWRVSDSGATVELRRGDGRRDTFTRNPDGTYANPPNVFDTFVKNGDGSYTLTHSSQIRHEFASSGMLTAIREPAGNQLTLAYTGANLTTITDTVGRLVSLSYDASNRVTQVQDPLGRKVTYAYDASGRLATVTDRIGNAVGEDPTAHQWKYAYDGTTQHITTTTDPDGRVRVRNTYDSQSRVYQQRDGLNALTQIAYSTGQTTVTNPRSHSSTYTFDSRMRVLTQTDVVGSQTYVLSYTYDTAGNRTSVTDRNGNRTDFTHDARGNVLTKTDPPPVTGAPRPVTSFTYDAKNNLTRISDPLAFMTDLTYDAASNALLSVSRQVEATAFATTKYEYGDAVNPGLPTKVIAPRGNVNPTPDYTFATTIAYDAQGNVASRTDPDGARTTFAYDAVGRLRTFVDPDGNAPGSVPAEHTWTVVHDENDRETRRVDPLGNALIYDYDGAGNRTSVADRRGSYTTYAYDGNARLITTQQQPDPVDQPTLFYTTQVTRDANGNATRITQANGVVTDYAFDPLDRLTSVTTHPDAQTNLVTSYVLDGNGQPTSRTTGDGVTVSYTYDALSRLTAVSGPSLSISYGYDAAGRRTQMVDATGTTTYRYDGLGRVTEIAQPNGVLTYAYNLDGNRTALGYPGALSVTYAYSPGGRMTTVTDWATRISRYTYQPSGLVATVEYPNTMRASYVYDRSQRLTRITNAVGSRTITDHAYTLDAEGNRTVLDEFVEGTTPPPIVWSASGRVNDDAGTTQQDRAAIALGPDGATYLVWDDFRSGSHADIYFARRDPASGAWSANQKVNNDTTTRTQWNAAIAVDGSNNAYAAWQDDRNGRNTPDTDIYFSKRSAATGTWSSNLRVNDDTKAATQRNPRVAVKGDGAANAVWVDFRSSQWNIYSSRLAAGGSTWAANIRVTDNTSSRKESPDVATAPNGTAYAVWEDDRSGNWDVWYATLAPGASAWSVNRKLSDDPGTAAQYSARIGIDAAGNAIVVWLDDRAATTQIRMSRLPAGSSTWDASRVISDAAAVPVALALAIRSDGNAFAAWQDGRSTSYDLWGADYTSAAGTWSTPARIDDDPGSAAQLRPAVALNTAEVALAWRDDRTGNADTRSRRRAPQGQGVDHFTYTYDGLSRLTSVTGPVSESFTLDPATNMSSRTGPMATYTYDTANRMTSDGSRSFVWDGADRLTQRGADTFSYDALGRMTSSTVSGSTRLFTLDGDGALRTATQGSSTTYVWDASTAPAPMVQAGTDRIVHGLGPLYTVRSDGTTVAFVRDGLGSVRAEVDGAGSVAKAFRYTAYGDVVGQVPGGAMPTILGFAGELRDSSGLTYLRARWYDPRTGRFLTVDPVEGRPSWPGTLNGYAYAGGNPSNYTDPTGKCTDPAPGAAGPRYCIAAFIPDPDVCVLQRCYAGDNRGPMSDGGSSRIELHIGPDGTWSASSGVTTRIRPDSAVRQSQPNCAGGGGGYVCTGRNPFEDLAPPIRLSVTFASGRIWISGTRFPSIEVWRYTGDTAQSLFHSEALPHGPFGIGAYLGLTTGFRAVVNK